MKNVLISIVVIGTFGALVWNQLNTSEVEIDNTTTNTVESYEEILSNWDAGPEMPEPIESAEIIDDESEFISFDEQFAIARESLGPNGLFVWEGNQYNCLYKEELEELINKAVEDSLKDINSKGKIQIVETILPVEEVEDSTLILNNGNYKFIP